MRTRACITRPRYVVGASKYPIERNQAFAHTTLVPDMHKFEKRLTRSQRYWSKLHFSSWLICFAIGVVTGAIGFFIDISLRSLLYSCRMCTRARMHVSLQGNSEGKDGDIN